MSRKSKIALVWGLVVVLIVLSFAFHRSPATDDPTQPAAQDEVVRRQHPEPPLADLGPPPRVDDRYSADRYTDEPPFASRAPAASRQDAVLLAPREIAEASPSTASSSRYAEEPDRSRETIATHRIVDGDTLSGLAERYLGRADRYLEIFEANRDSLTDPDLLPIGLELRIPATAAASSRSQMDAGSRLVPIPRGTFRRQTEYPAMTPSRDY